MNAPEYKELNSQISNTTARIKILEKNLKSKIKELDSKIKADNDNLFGERESEPKNTAFLFSERVNISQRAKVLEPLKNELKTAKNELSNLYAKKNNIEVTASLF
jgi:uncharacterized protein (DUF3084 family)